MATFKIKKVWNKHYRSLPFERFPYLRKVLINAKNLDENEAFYSVDVQVIGTSWPNAGRYFQTNEFTLFDISESTLTNPEVMHKLMEARYQEILRNVNVASKEDEFIGSFTDKQY